MLSSSLSSDWAAIAAVVGEALQQARRYCTIHFPTMRLSSSCFLIALSALLPGAVASGDLFFLGSGEHVHTVAPDGARCVNSLAATLVNDDFCDCADGSDETRTSACAHVDWHAMPVAARPQFVCQNYGHIPKNLSPSRVSDGVCDCCDGTDEPAGRCGDDCFEVRRETDSMDG